MPTFSKVRIFERRKGRDAKEEIGGGEMGGKKQDEHERTSNIFEHRIMWKLDDDICGIPGGSESFRTGRLPILCLEHTIFALCLIT
jgi:hypothetical protein